MDRLRTPESDSGLSEKSFNLNIQENEEAVTNEVNEAKANMYIEPENVLHAKNNEFDTTSKDDSGIVDIDEHQNNFDSNNEHEVSSNLKENQNEGKKDSGIETKRNDLTIEEPRHISNATNDAAKEKLIANISEMELNTNKNQQENALVSENTIETEKDVVNIEPTEKRQQFDLSKKPEDSILPSMSDDKTATIEAKIVDQLENKEPSKDDEVVSESDSKPLPPIDSDSKGETLIENKNEKDEVDEVKNSALGLESTNLPEQTSDQKQSKAAQSTPENVVSKETNEESMEKSTLDSKEAPNQENTTKTEKKPNQTEEVPSQSELNAEENSLKEKPKKDLTGNLLNEPDTNEEIKKENVNTNESTIQTDDQPNVNKSIEILSIESKSQECSEPIDEKMDQNQLNTTVTQNKSSTEENNGSAEMVAKIETGQQSQGPVENIDEKSSQNPIDETISLKSIPLLAKTISNADDHNETKPKELSETIVGENAPEEDKNTMDQPEIDSNSVKSVMSKDFDSKSDNEESSGNLMEGENSKRNKRQAPTLDDVSDQTEKIEKMPTDAVVEKGERMPDTMGLSYSIAKSEVDTSDNAKNEEDLKRTFLEPEKHAEQIDGKSNETQNKDTPMENNNQSESEAIEMAQDVQEIVQNSVRIPSVTANEEKITLEENANNNENQPEIVASDATISLESEPISIPINENNNNKDIEESIEPLNNDDKSWKKVNDKVVEKVTDQDANQTEGSVSPLSADTSQNLIDDIAAPKPAIQTAEGKESEKSLATDSNEAVHSTDVKKIIENNQIEDKLTEHEEENDKTKVDLPVKSEVYVNKGPNEIVAESVKENFDETKSIQGNESNEFFLDEPMKNENSQAIDDIKNKEEKSASLDANKIVVKNENENKSENGKPSNENDSRHHSVTENDQVKQEDRNESDQLEAKLDLTTNDETDDVYSTPPDTANNDRSSVSHDQSVEIDTKRKLNENTSNGEKSEENMKINENKEGIIEKTKLDSPNLEESNLVDEVKLNPIMNATNSEGVNKNSIEMSTMPAEEASVDETDSKITKNGNSTENVNIVDENKNFENLSVDKKTANEIDHASDCEMKTNNEDVASELSASARDEYEQAETEAIGDESVKDLDLSSNLDLEPNQANESAESEQQITAVEIQLHNDNDSIDSPQQNQMQPDSLDILIDSLDASLEPSVDADSLNIDSLNDKPRSAKSTDTGKRKDSIDGIIEEDACLNYGTHDKMEKQPSEQRASDNSNKSFLLEVPKVKLNSLEERKQIESPEEIAMGDAVLDNDQMRNELEVLRLAENSAPMPKVQEVDSPVVPEQNQTMSITASDNDEPHKKSVSEPNSEQCQKDVKNENKSEEDYNEQIEETTDVQTKDQATSITESSNETNSNGITEDQTEQSFDLNSTTNDSSENQTTSDEIVEVVEVVEVVEIVEKIKCVDYLKPSHDTQSSDLSDTDTTDKAEEKAYTESGVDETSRDERDEVSEIENFDLSSCGEDSLEAMYYMIRKNEIIMDRHKQTGAKKCDDEKITFPEKVTYDLEHAVSEVSGNKSKLCSIPSMNSFDEVVLKKMSSDSDEIQLHVIPNDMSSSDQKSCPLKEQCTANESTDDEYINPIVDSMQKNEDALNEMHAKALSVQPNRSDTQCDGDDQQFETDTFNEHSIDMDPGNIERKILASSVSEADSDYFELPPNANNRLTKDDFNVSTAFEHMIRSESTTDDSDSIESAATKIQAGARGFLARRRIRKSASNEKRSSIGNAAIDKSLDNLIEQQELLEENAYIESIEENSPQSDTFNNKTFDSIDSEKILGITEVKVEHRKDEPHTDDTGSLDNVSNDEKVPEINIQGTSEESATQQRRAMLQRGDAMQRNSTPESSEQQIDKEKLNTEPTNKEENNNQDEQKIHDNDTKIDAPLANASKPLNKPMRGLGPRQRSMPVQIDSQLMRVLPKHKKKRIKSANSNTKNLRPFFF
ncbi:titin-like [Contarinia nasturtii]|uniref:titin-like n=1 Tax=Contarinia nasturtii TaxID=265458 RepID=UPI0012D43BE4|nr:titin-like [Contarinia nasturtii]